MRVICDKKESALVATTFDDLVGLSPVCPELGWVKLIRSGVGIDNVEPGSE